MSLIEWVQNSTYAAEIRESQYIYPLLQCIHITGIGMFAGSVALVNLRLAGIGRAVPLIDFSRHAMQVAWLGLALILLTGVNMALSFIEVFAVSPVMQAKLCLVVLAIGNAVIIQRNIAGGDHAVWMLAPPSAAKARGWVTIGIAVLIAVITLGKLLAYIGGKD